MVLGGLTKGWGWLSFPVGFDTLRYSSRKTLLQVEEGVSPYREAENFCAHLHRTNILWGLCYNFSMQAWKLILIGFLLCLSGVIFPFLMVVEILESTFLLNFLSYIASVLGLFLGIIGAAYYVRENRQK